MAKYRLQPDGSVQDTETSAFIPNDDRVDEQGNPLRVTNNQWKAYKAWLAAGNTPDPVPPPPVKTDADLLNESDQKMIRAVDWLLETLVAKGVLTLPEIPQALKDLYLERKAQRGA